MPEEAQLISPKSNFVYPLKSIHNSNVEISRPKTPLHELHTCQKLNILKDKASIKQHYHDALLADFVYSRDFMSLEVTQWALDRELARYLFKETKKKVCSEQGLFKDSSTGLVAYIFYNRAEQKIRLEQNVLAALNLAWVYKMIC